MTGFLQSRLCCCFAFLSASGLAQYTATRSETRPSLPLVALVTTSLSAVNTAAPSACRAGTDHDPHHAPRHRARGSTTRAACVGVVAHGASVIWHLYAKCLDCGAEPQEPCRDENNHETEVCETREMIEQPRKKKGPARPNARTRARSQGVTSSCACGRTIYGDWTTCSRRLCRGAT